VRGHWLLPCLLFLAGCNALGEFAAKFIPPLERVNEDWAPPQMECEPRIATTTPRQCIASQIACGDTVEGHSAAGKKKWGDEFYRGAKCVPSSYNYDAAPEMTYRLKLKPNQEAIVKLISDCGDLDLFGFRWEDKDLECPAARHYGRIAECEMEDTPRGGAIKLTAVNKPVNFLVGVDGKKGATGNYRISVTCRQNR